MGMILCKLIRKKSAVLGRGAVKILFIGPKILSSAPDDVNMKYIHILISSLC